MKSELIRIKQDIYEKLQQLPGLDINEKISNLLSPSLSPSASETTKQPIGQETLISQYDDTELKKAIKELEKGRQWLVLQNDAAVRNLANIEDGLDKLISKNKLMPP